MRSAHSRPLFASPELGSEGANETRALLFAAFCLGLALALVATVLILGCSAEAPAEILPQGDLSPPSLLEAGPTGSRRLVLRFDEPIEAIADSFGLEPRLACRAEVQETSLVLDVDEAFAPGADYRLAGEVADSGGNRTRFLLRFCGWNERLPSLRISELQTAKNSSKSKPRRDYVELRALGSGNLGGVELSWASSVKEARYRFPGCEVAQGDYIVLHLAPEGIAEERDEVGSSLELSGGIDSSPGARDFWCGALALPDESGAVALRLRPGGTIEDGLFYAPTDKAGRLAEGSLESFVAEMASDGAWQIRGSSPAWEDAFRWKPSSSRSICRGEGGGSWYVPATGGQSPGGPNNPPGAPGTDARGRGSAKGSSR